MVEKDKKADEDVADSIGERLGEITKRLQWVRKETEKKIEPIKPFTKEVKEKSVWLKKLGNEIKKAWESLWRE